MLCNSLSRVRHRVEFGLILLGVFLLPVQVVFAETLSSLELSEATRLISQKKWSDAVIALRSFLKKYPHSMPGVISLSTALIQSGRREEALGALNEMASTQKGLAAKVLTSKVKVLSTLFLTNEDYQTYQEGLILLQQKKYRAAYEKFSKVSELEPDHVQVLVRLAQSLFMDGDYDSAAERLRFAKKLNPYEPEVHLWLGRSLYFRGELLDAIQELQFAYKSEDLLPDQVESASLWYSEALIATGKKALGYQVLLDDVKRFPLHLSSMVMAIRMSVHGVSPNVNAAIFSDKAALWKARTDTQLALSRLDDYMKEDSEEYERDLSLNLKPSAEQMKAEIIKLQKEIETAIAKLNA